MVANEMPKSVRVLPYLLFIASGAWGLVYEVTWARYLSLFIGNTTLAHMCVLAGFMGGLALGSFVIGAATRQFRRPLAVYGWLETAIGLYAIIFPLIIHPIQSLALVATARTDFGSPVALAVKLAVSIGALILPTFLMGGTFPVLMKHFQPESEQKDDKAEWLYLANCVGAVGGTLLAGFMLIPTLGMRMTMTTIGAANVALGLVAVMLGMLCDVTSCSARELAKSGSVARHPLVIPICIAAALSGATAMIYELVWICMFGITLGSSTYSFTLMLAAFITGLALGSLAVGLCRRLNSQALSAFAFAEIAIAFSVAISIPYYERLPYVFWRWSFLLFPTEQTLGMFNLLKYTLCFIVMLVPTFFFGMTLPLAIKAVARRDEDIGRDSGLVYGANTVGTLAGSFLAGIVLIPILGLRESLQVAVALNMIVSALLLAVSKLPRKWVFAGGASVAIAVLLFSLPQWHPASFSRGTFRVRMLPPPETWRAFRSLLSEIRVFYVGEDGSARVAVISAENLKGRYDKLLTINGKPDGTSWGDMPTQVLLGQIPMFFKPDARNVLVIGLGTGATAGSVLTHPNTIVDCVEISPAVARALRYFDDVNWMVRKNPRFNLIIEDARTVAAVTQKKYDVVISEPSNPWMAGVGNLFTIEFFQSLDRILNPGGILAQWFHSYEMSDELVAIIIRTVRQVFPYVYIFETQANDYILLASRDPISPNFEAMEKRIALDSVKRDLQRISITSLIALLSRQTMSAETAEEVAGIGIVNCDDFPVLEYQAPRSYYIGEVAECMNSNDERKWGNENLFSVRYMRFRKLNKEDYRSLIKACLDSRMKHPALLLALLKHYLMEWPNDAEMLIEYAKALSSTEPLAALRAAHSAVQIKPNVQSLELEADVLLSEVMRRQSVFTPQDFAPILDLLDRAIKLDPKNRRLQEKRREVVEMMQ